MTHQPSIDPEVSRGWDPISPLTLPALLQPAGQDWWLGGGWALDAWIGHPTRIHEDTDAIVFREDVVAFLEHLPGWCISLADPPGSLRPWIPGESIPEGVHDIWCRHASSERWQFQFMVIDGTVSSWRYRRDERISGLRATMGRTVGAMRVLAPEIQLLYKIRSPRRPKDVSGLKRFVPRLDRARRQWLEDAVTLAHPDDLEFLRSL
jgi:hypothetical protein